MWQRMRTGSATKGAKDYNWAMIEITTWTSWHRWTAISLLAHIFLAVAAAFQRARDEQAGIFELIPSPSLSCSDSSAAPSSPSPAATSANATAGRYGDAATSITRGKPTNAGMPMPMSCPDNDLQLP